jgi:hypothetical protein
MVPGRLATGQFSLGGKPGQKQLHHSILIMYILGLNAFHADSSAAIFKDGVMIAATEEERFTRVKHWAGFPVQAINFCLREAGISLEQVDHRFPATGQQQGGQPA